MSSAVIGQMMWGRWRAMGFTLVEVMIVVLVIGILMTIALPSYQEHTRKGRRTDAMAALLDVANRQEQLMLDRSIYTIDMTVLGFAADPMVSPEEHYTIDALAPTADCPITRCFSLTATPRESSPQAADERCTSFVLASSGARSATGSAASECW